MRVVKIIKIDAINIIKQFLQASARLDDYIVIMTQYSKVNISVDSEFQKLFNGYYRVRREQHWREQYYDVFQSVKSESPTFEAILRQLYNKTGQIEASFTSKMLATIEPEKPVWDSRVLRALGLSQNYYNKERIDNCVKTYSQIQSWYDEYLMTEEAADCIKVFDEYMPDYRIVSSVKKIDFFLWAKS
jgi:hypothetical protein